MLYNKNVIHNHIHGLFLDIPEANFQRSSNDTDYQSRMIVEASGFLTAGSNVIFNKKLSQAKTALPKLDSAPESGFTAQMTYDAINEVIANYFEYKSEVAQEPFRLHDIQFELDNSTANYAFIRSKMPEIDELQTTYPEQNAWIQGVRSVR